MVDINWTVFLQIANFLILIFVLNTVLYKPIRNILLQRKEKVSGLEGSIDTLSQDAKKQDEAYALGIKEARAKGMKEKEALVKAASDEEKEIVRKINERAQADLAAIREKVAKDADKVRSALNEKVDAFARDIGQKILGRAV